jgi:hypothetical protein
MANRSFNQGKCDNCGFTGLVTRRPFVLHSDALDGKFDVTNPPVRTVCVTCHYTPDGAMSENVRHRRLPEGEYRVPYK